MKIGLVRGTVATRVPHAASTELEMRAISPAFYQRAKDTILAHWQETGRSLGFFVKRQERDGIEPPAGFLDYFFTDSIRRRSSVSALAEK